MGVWMIHNWEFEFIEPWYDDEWQEDEDEDAVNTKDIWEEQI